LKLFIETVPNQTIPSMFSGFKKLLRVVFALAVLVFPPGKIMAFLLQPNQFHGVASRFAGWPMSFSFRSATG